MGASAEPPAAPNASPGGERKVMPAGGEMAINASICSVLPSPMSSASSPPRAAAGLAKDDELVSVQNQTLRPPSLRGSKIDDGGGVSGSSRTSIHARA